MSVTIRPHSRLQFSELLVSDSNVEFWDLVSFPTIPTQPDDIYYVVQGSDRIDTLAYKFYNDPVLWWVIAYANDMYLLPTDLSIGDQITIPSPRYVLQFLFKK